MKKKKIGLIIGSRANYASIKSVISHISKRRDSMELLIFVGASALLERYGRVADLVEEDGFSITEKFYILVEGENPQTMAMSVGLGMIELAGLFMNHKPDVVITVGDRFETIATAVTASYMNIHLAHTMGGEISGTIDESIRHAVTKFSHIHFPANKEAAGRIIRMGEDPGHVFVTGCPRIDLVKELIEENRNGGGIDKNEFWKKYKGVGEEFDLEKERFLLVSQHPVTTEYGMNRARMRETLMALYSKRMPTILLWPNADAGSDEISKEIRTFREKYKPDGWLHLFKNLPIEIYTKLMDMCACMVGNSSSALREGAIVGVPAVNIGTRQQGRSRGKNIVDADYDREKILDAMNGQLKNSKFEPDYLYGDGKAGEKIAKILAEIDLNKIYLQKKFIV
ncbi:MAG: UDP-N-acetylglucosamine 2-epimerase (hydrolyzing) [Candidatus Omnitrophica bacterium]|nr:UDP-N-acetylglucosamine 2-epimerase (hydrolyzing) [Candidatus Omnitrophota bacterium]